MATSPSGKSYIGQARSDARHGGDGFVRFRQHAWNEQTAIHDAIQYYGIDNFKVTILVKAPDNQLNMLERKLIDAYGTYGKWGYNQTSGGDVNPMHDQSVRDKCRATNARPDVKAKHKASMVDVMNTSAVRSKISKTLSKKLANADAREQRRKQLAACDQEKRLANLSKAAKSEKTKAKRIATRKQFYIDHPEATKRKSEALKAAWARRKAKAA